MSNRTGRVRICNVMRLGNITGIENVTEFDSNLDWKVHGIAQ